MSYSITQHAETRMNQRGIRKEDFGLLLAIADQVASDVYLMTNEIVDEEIARQKKRNSAVREAARQEIDR